MRKTSHLKKFIPVSVLIHAAAIFAASLVTAPLILKQDTSLEMAMGSGGDSEKAETLGIDVLATQGTHQESTMAPDNSRSATSNNPAVENSNTVKSEPVTPTIISEELTIPVAKEEPKRQEAPQDLAPTETTPPPEAVAVTLPEETPEEEPAAKTNSSEIAQEKTEEIKPTPIATNSSAKTEEADSKSTDSEKSVMSASKSTEGMGAGTNGANAPSQGLAGSATGIKSLEQIRQRAGNPKPRYDRDERLRGDKGTVVFKAYINQAGQPVKIEKITSSGHPNLDTKSLVALEKWKFEPGQEGWVEVPFKWDLKGDSQEIGGSLRRSAANPVETP